jgi:hypothetical protein
MRLPPSGQYYNCFTAAITPLASYFSMILTNFADIDIITAVKGFIILATGVNQT